MKIKKLKLCFMFTLTIAIALVTVLPRGSFLKVEPVKIYAEDSNGDILPHLQVFDKKFFVGQVFDTQREPAYPTEKFTMMRLFDFEEPYSDVLDAPILNSREGGANSDGYYKVSWAEAATNEDPYVCVKFYDADDCWLEDVSLSGRIYCIFDEGFLYISTKGDLGYIFFYEMITLEELTVEVDEVVIDRTSRELESALPVYAVSVNNSDKNFDKAFVGYGEQTAEQFIITNIGNQTLTNLTATLAGTNADAFEISTVLSADSVAVEKNVTISVRPVTGLGAGEYTAVLQIRGSDGIEMDITLSFTVDAAGNDAAGDAGNGGLTITQIMIYIVLPSFLLLVLMIVLCLLLHRKKKMKNKLN